MQETINLCIPVSELSDMVTQLSAIITEVNKQQEQIAELQNELEEFKKIIKLQSKKSLWRRIIGH